MEDKTLNKKTITLGSLEAKIEEIGGLRKFCIPYMVGEIPSYQIKVLEKRMCPRLLDMDFMTWEELQWIYYNFSGYLQFADLFSIWKRQERSIARETCQVLLQTVRIVLAGENCLLSQEGFSLHPDTVFINPQTQEVRLAYVPGIPHKSSIQDCMVELIAASELLSCDDQWECYGEEIRKKIISDNYGLKEIVKFLGEKSREMYCREWPAKSLLRESTKTEAVKEEESPRVRLKWPLFCHK